MSASVTPLSAAERLPPTLPRVSAAPGTPPIRIEPIEDAQAEAWDVFVRSRSDAAAYHLYRWRNVVRAALGRETHYLAARGGADGEDRITGVLPLVRLKSLLFGDFLVSMPYFNYGGALAETPEIGAGLIEAACDLGRRLGVSHVELRHVGNVCSTLPARTDKVTLMLALAQSAEELWKAIPSKVRSQVRRPEKAGATVVCGGLELLEDFYGVFAANMRDLGTPVYGRNFFRAILEQFPQAARIFVVHLSGQPVAAGFVVGHGDTLEIPWASSLRSANAVSPNMLLYWKVLEYACGRYARFDFGRCTPDGGTFRFKRQWGAVPLQLHWHYWLRDGGEPPRLNHSNPKYAAAAAAWRQLPLFVANRLGPMLVRNLP